MDKAILQKDYEEITDVTFDHEGAHLASTHMLQGGASNGKNTPLILKSENTDAELNKALEQITVTMSMEKYLKTFFDMWYDDAELLVKLMGMETEYEYYERMEKEDKDSDLEEYESYHQKYLAEKLSKVELLRSAKDIEFKDLEGEQLEVVKDHMVQFVKGVAKHQDEFSESLEKSKNKDVGTEDANSKEFSSTANGTKEEVAKGSSDPAVADTSGGGDNVTQQNEGDSITQENLIKEANMSTKNDPKTQDDVAIVTKTLEKSAVELDLEKAQAQIADLEKKSADLEKAQAKIAVLEKAEEARLEKAFGNMAEGYSYIDAESKADLAKAMMSIRDTDAAVVLFQALEKAQSSLATAIEVEKGVEGEAEIDKDAGKSTLNDLIKAKYANQV